MKRAKLKWPVAKVREDGTPAIWLTHTNWLLLEDGIVRAYLDRRRYVGQYEARQIWRKQLGTGWRENKRLADMATVDSWNYDSDVEAAMELFEAGYNAWRRYADQDLNGWHWTPDKLRELGDRKQREAYAEEEKEIISKKPLHDSTK